MRRTILSLLAVLLCGLWGASTMWAGGMCNVSGNLVANCAFDTGDFTSWGFTGNTTNPNNNYYGVDSFDADNPNVGNWGGTDTGANYGAYLSQDAIAGAPALPPATTNDLIMSQAVAFTPGTYDINFWLADDTSAGAGYYHYLVVSFGGVTLGSFCDTTYTGCSTVVTSFGTYTDYNFMTSAAASGVLSFTIQNDDSYWSLDDVSVINETTAEPASVFLLGTLLLFGGWMLSRFMKAQRASDGRL